MTMHKTLHPRDNTGFVCQEKKEEDDSLTLKIEDSVDTSIKQFKKE